MLSIDDDIQPPFSPNGRRGRLLPHGNAAAAPRGFCCTASRLWRSPGTNGAKRLSFLLAIPPVCRRLSRVATSLTYECEPLPTPPPSGHVQGHEGGAPVTARGSPERPNSAEEIFERLRLELTNEAERRSMPLAEVIKERIEQGLESSPPPGGLKQLTL